MSVFKEAMYITQELSDMQTQVYDDACDYGIPVYSFTDDKSVQMVKQLVDMYFCPESDTREVIRYDTGKTVRVTIEMIEEWQSKKSFPVIIEYVTTKGTHLPDRHKGMVGYISLNSDDWLW